MYDVSAQCVDERMMNGESRTLIAAFTQVVNIPLTAYL